MTVLKLLLERHHSDQDSFKIENYPDGSIDSYFHLGDKSPKRIVLTAFEIDVLRDYFARLAAALKEVRT